jgi:hypothetical protein
VVPFLVLALLVGGAGGISVSDRVDGERAVERARYKFVIGATQPFDEAYPRSVFEKKVARELAEERVLQKTFGLAVTPAILAAEFDRIEKATKAPDQWEAIMAALQDDRRRIEEVFCRPLVVERTLRAKFDFDQAIHAGPHQRAREARTAFLAGKKPAGVTTAVLARAASGPDTADMLDRAQKEAALPRVLSPPEEGAKDEPAAIHPEMAAVLEKQFRKPGDVSTILEERDRFSVFRLIEARPDSWRVEAVIFPKVDFDAWFDGVRSKT